MIINKTNEQVTKMFNLMTQTSINLHVLKILAKTTITGFYVLRIKMLSKPCYKLIHDFDFYPANSVRPAASMFTHHTMRAILQ
jgi:nitrogen regulatory protein PII-like uncharacterized protein